MNGKERRTPAEGEADFRAYLRGLARREDAELESMNRAHPELTAAVEELRRVWETISPQAALSLTRMFSRELRELREAGSPGPDEESVSLLDPASAGVSEASSGPPTAGVPSSTSRFFKRAQREHPAPAPGLEPGKLVAGFRLVAMIGQGGMGQIWEAEQLSLGGRRIAVKFVRPDRVSPHQLEYFAREARAGGRLHHPGIVTVHGSGESGGLAWIAMELVEGSWTLRDFLVETARAGEVPPGYDRDVARLVAEIAEAMQTAHDAGVIHRDLKPQNVLIAPDDRPRITDFGLARITDETAISQTGEFAGSYFYMSPEQVAAKRAGIDHRTDQFSLGVVLYELLALRRPFVGDTSHQVAAQILAKEPPDPRSIRSRVPRDLAVIAGKALEKDRDRRYGSMADLAADLRRYLRDEPIHARPPTRGERAVKWARRHPTESVAGAVAAAAFVAISLLLGENVKANRELGDANIALDAQVTSVKRLSALQKLEDLIDEADDAETMWPARPSRIQSYEDWIDRAHELLDELPLHRAKREELRALARPRTEEERAKDREAHPEVLRLAELEQEIARRRRALDWRRDGASAKEPAPVEAPEVVVTMEWAEALFEEGRDDEALDMAYAALEAAGEAQQESLEARYQALEAGVMAATSEAGLASAQSEIEALEADRRALEALVDERRDWRFPPEEKEARWWHNQLAKLIDGLEQLTDEESGLLAMKGISPEHGWSVPKRLAFAREQESASAPGGQYDARWNAALPLIHAAYPGVELPVQAGLVPIGVDPASRLWEFWLPQSGAEPLRDEDGKLEISDESGLVLVLLPGARFQMGAQGSEADGPNYDPDAQEIQGPVHEVVLSPFFLSKYELTQGQWKRLVARNPSMWNPEARPASIQWTHPVEQVDWHESDRVLAWLGLELPSEAQWEYGARAGTSTPYSCPMDELASHANLADQTYARRVITRVTTEDWTDGFRYHAPVGSLSPNGFGLHDVHGNVWEWCRDRYGGYDLPARAVDGERVVSGGERRIYRGGSLDDLAKLARSAHRSRWRPSLRRAGLGVRPAGRIAPD